MPPASPRNRSKRAAPPTKRASRTRSDKLSISLPPEDVRWVTHRARQLGTSVSAVVASAVADQRRAEARERLLSFLGEDDVSEADVAAARSEAFGD